MSFCMGDIGGLWNVSFGGVLLGDNMNVRVRQIDDVALVKTAQGGSSPVDGVFTGRMVEIECIITRSTLAQIRAAMPAGTTVDADQLIVSNPVGIAASGIDPLNTEATHLYLYKDAAAPPQWFFPFAVPAAVAEWVFDAGTQRTTRAVFRAIQSGEYTNDVTNFSGAGPHSPAASLFDGRTLRFGADVPATMIIPAGDTGLRAVISMKTAGSVIDVGGLGGGLMVVGVGEVSSYETETDEYLGYLYFDGSLWNLTTQHPSPPYISKLSAA